MLYCPSEVVTVLSMVELLVCGTWPAEVLGKIMDHPLGQEGQVLAHVPELRGE